MGSAQISAHFAGDAASAGPARRFLAAALQAWDCPELEETAVLLVSELMANVALHSGGETDVVVRLDGDRLRVEVHDRSRVLPQRKHYSRTSTTGRGLALVEQLADTWGVDPTATGKQVWFELDRFGPRARSAAQAVDLDAWADLDVGEAPGAARPPAGGAIRGDAGPGRAGRAAHRQRASSTR